ncbi:hypothetical protein BCR32DRAFT_327179 [Anaeromyces robustus]|uniref:Uncharacterized protein n=1 Tax=Anaeromyces robustus TaxID=1754192 RepID=A0A1Y1X7R6_9FUNG|nr:hypothetical protein BCR32DRAFT_327179 [Anaeromyces robustus]|eukprot:ORX81797.1 hypothetical protein BCR32DRAFT_327179 [Anaeromyces robustus]
MKKLSILAIFCFLLYLAEAANISRNGATRKCYKKIKSENSSTEDDNNNDNNNNENNENNEGEGVKKGKVSVSCKSLITEINGTEEYSPEKINTYDIDTSNNSNDENSNDEEAPQSAKFNFIDNLSVPKGTVLNNNEECVKAINNINKVLKQSSKDFSFEITCNTDFDLDKYMNGINTMKYTLSSYIDEAINQCGNSKIWNGAKIHQACRILSQTGQTVCHSLVDNIYEKYDSKCLDNATFKDMWEFSSWLWDQLININNGCYLKQLYNYKCQPSKDTIANVDSNNHYSLRLLCESEANSCHWPGTYTGNNPQVQCLSQDIIKNRDKAIQIFEKNGYVCEGSNTLPKLILTSDDNNSDNENESIPTNGAAIIINDDNNNNINGFKPNLNADNKNMVSSGSEPWTNTNQIIGTIFIALFALLF